MSVLSFLSGKHDGEGAAFTLRAFHLYCAAVSIYNLPYDGEADTGAVDAVRPARRAAHELGKDLRLFTAGDAESVVAHADRNRSLAPLHSTRTVWLSPEYLTALSSRFQSACAEGLRVGVNRAAGLRHFTLELKSPGRPVLLKFVDYAMTNSAACSRWSR